MNAFSKTAASQPTTARRTLPWLPVVALVAALGGVLGGVLGDQLGYATAFATGTVLSALGCVFLVSWLDRHPTHERVAQAWR